MVFERFTQAGRGYRPKVSVTRTGLIGLNQGSVKRFKLQDYNYVVLYYDREGQRIGIQPTNDENEEGIRKLRKRVSGADVSAKAFFDYYDIDYNTTKRYNALWDDDNNMIIVRLKQDTNDAIEDEEELS